MNLRHEEEAESLRDEVGPCDANVLAVNFGEDGCRRGDGQVDDALQAKEGLESATRRGLRRRAAAHVDQAHIRRKDLQQARSQS